MRMRHPFTSVLFLLAAVLLSGGCCSVKSYNVTVALDEGLKGPGGMWPSMEVDLVAVNNAEYPRWVGYSINDYFKSGNQFRRDAPRFTVGFTNEDHQPKTLSARDAIWNQWLNRGAERLFVVAFLPGQHPDQEGERDPRRLILPLKSCRWEGDTLHVVVQSSGVVCTTPMKPEDK